MPPLHNLRDEEEFSKYRANIEKMFAAEDLLFDGYDAHQMTNMMWCSFNEFLFIKGEPHKDSMKYFIAVREFEGNKYLATTFFIHKDFAGQAKEIAGQGLIDFSNENNIDDCEIFAITVRSAKLFARKFADFGGQYLGYALTNSKGIENTHYSLKCGKTYNDKYLKVISTSQGGMKDRI